MLARHHQDYEPFLGSGILINLHLPQLLGGGTTQSIVSKLGVAAMMKPCWFFRNAMKCPVFKWGEIIKLTNDRYDQYYVCHQVVQIVSVVQD